MICKQIKKTAKKSHYRCIWSKSEDKVLKSAIKEHNGVYWKAIADLINSVSNGKTQPKTGKQCRERWLNFLNPIINDEPLSNSEVKKVIMLHKILGNRWSKIAREFAGRTDNTIKNWFMCRLKRIARCIKKRNILLELPKNPAELQQVLYLLDHLYKYYVSPNRRENTVKKQTTKTKKRGNKGDNYINKLVSTEEITLEKLSYFAKGIMNELKFHVEKDSVKEYNYLMDLHSNSDPILIPNANERSKPPAFTSGIISNHR